MLYLKNESRKWKFIKLNIFELVIVRIYFLSFKVNDLCLDIGLCVI